MHKQLLVAGALVVAALWAGASTAAASSSTQSHAKPVQAHNKPAPVKIAPADEYFGRMKMSILGISNAIRDTGVREDYDPANAGRYYTSLALTEDALQDWARKYPQDGWIPKRAYDLSHDFWKVHTPAGNKEAQRCRGILFSRFPRNHWAMIARRETAASIAPLPAQPPVATVSKPQR